MNEEQVKKEAIDIKNMMATSRKEAEKFALIVRDVAIDFIKNESRDVVKIGDFTITYKRPWFLNEKKFGKELEIKRKDECILSWIVKLDSYRENWVLNDLEMKEVKDLRDFIRELHKHMDTNLDFAAMFGLRGGE